MLISSRSTLILPLLSRTIDHRLNSIAVFHPDAGLLWQSPASVSGVLPVAREQHTAVLIPAAASTGAAASSSAPFSSLDCQSPHLLVFGGRSNPSHALHDIALLNLSTYEWVSLPPATMGAGVTVEQIKRFRHTAVWAQHKMIVYGGCKYETHDASAGGPCTVHTVYNDVLVLDTSVSPMHWERVTPAGCQEAKPSSTTTGVDAAVDTTDTTDSDLAVMPHKHTHAAAYCSASQSWYIFGGYSDANFHRNPTDNALYRLSMSSSSPSEWSWQCLSGDLTGVPPPPIASSTLHVLSKRFLLLLGGVSSEDMYSLSSLWVVDLHRQTWSRPTLHAGSNTRFHPVIERQLALQENRRRHRTEEDATTTEEKTDDTTLVESANGGAPVRIVEHSFICKHSAVFVDSRLAAAGDIDDTMDLLLCGGGGNVFHFNPFFNPTLRFVVRIPRESAASQPNTDGGDIEITVDSVTAQ